MAAWCRQGCAGGPFVGGRIIDIVRCNAVGCVAGGPAAENVELAIGHDDAPQVIAWEGKGRGGCPLPGGRIEYFVGANGLVICGLACNCMNGPSESD